MWASLADTFQMVRRIVDQSKKMIASHVVATRNTSTQELFKMISKAQISLIQKTKITQGEHEQIVLAYDHRLKWGPKKTKHLYELRHQIASFLEEEGGHDHVMVDSLQIHPDDGKPIIYGTFVHRYESLDDLAARTELDPDCKMLNTINEEVESIRIILRQ